MVGCSKCLLYFNQGNANFDQGIVNFSQGNANADQGNDNFDQGNAMLAREKPQGFYKQDGTPALLTSLEVRVYPRGNSLIVSVSAD